MIKKPTSVHKLSKMPHPQNEKSALSEAQKSPLLTTTVVLKRPTEMIWVNHILDHFDAFLLDHACAEKKASAMAMSMIAHYPNKTKLVKAMTDLALEEMIHFREVMQFIFRRRLQLQNDTKDAYITALRRCFRGPRQQYLLDQLLVAAIVEARGQERFGLIAKHHPEPEFQKFYQRITESEAKHNDLFLNLALHYCEESEVLDRLQALVSKEADIISQLPITAALH